MEIDIVGYKQIGPTVAVIIAEGGARCPLGIAGQPRGARDIGKCAVSIVAIENYAPEARNQQVGPAVVVESPTTAPCAQQG